MNQIYKKENYVVIPVGNNFLIINRKKIFEEGHTHIKSFSICKLLIDLAIKKELPRNAHLVDSLVRISQDEEYIKKLQEFKEEEKPVSIGELMRHDSYKRHRGAVKQR